MAGKKEKPSTNGKHGRNTKGQFVRGHRLSVGNKGNQGTKARELKQALINAVNVEDIEEIAQRMLEQAKQGDIAATKELFDRLFGKAPQSVDLGENAARTIYDILAKCGTNGGHGN
jgi:uncharacterized ferredoxin-like protein